MSDASAPLRPAPSPRAGTRARELAPLLAVAAAFFAAYFGLRSISGVRAVEALRPLAAAAAARSSLDPNVLLAVVVLESGGDPAARSAAGAIGLAQLKLPAAADAARRLGESPPSEAELLDPATNLRLAASYLRSLQDRFGDLDVALAAYLKGPQWVEQKGGPDAVRTSLSSPSEIATYVHRVEDLAERLRLRAGASRAARRAVRWARPRRSGRGAPHPRRRGRRP